MEHSLAAGPSFVSSRRRLLDTQLGCAGVTDERIISAIHAVPRELFVSPRDGAGSVPDPCAVARALQALDLRPTARVLEVGIRSGYTAAILSLVVAEVFSLAIDSHRAEGARERLAAYGYARIAIKSGDVLTGWAAQAPFDGVVIGLPSVDVSPALLAQLAPGGRVVTLDGLRLA